MGENVRTHYEVHIHGLKAEEFNQVCDRLGINPKTIETEGGIRFRMAELVVPYTGLEVTYYTRDLT